MRRDLFQETLIGVLPIVLGIAALVLLPEHQFFSNGFPSPTTPDFFPSLVGIFLVAIGLLLLLRAKQSVGIQKETHEPMVSMPVYQTCIIFFVYWMTLNPLGFMTSSSIAILGLTYIFRERWRWQLIAFAISLPFFVSLIFKKSANVYLPTGLWF